METVDVVATTFVRANPADAKSAWNSARHPAPSALSQEELHQVQELVALGRMTARLIAWRDNRVDHHETTLPAHGVAEVLQDCNHLGIAHIYQGVLDEVGVRSLRALRQTYPPP